MKKNRCDGHCTEIIASSISPVVVVVVNGHHDGDHHLQQLIVRPVVLHNSLYRYLHNRPIRTDANHETRKMGVSLSPPLLLF